MAAAQRTHRTRTPTLLLLAVAGASLGAWHAPAPAALADATFHEYVGIGGFNAQGADLSAAEIVSLTVRSEDWADRGGGTGHAWTSALQPVSAGLSLNLFGGPNLSGIGGTATTQTRYAYSLVRIDDAAPDAVELLFTGAVRVTVAESDGFIGQSFARIMISGRQFQVKNCDAHGCYNGVFERHWVDESLGVVAVGGGGTIDIYNTSHGEGAGVVYTFDSTVFADPVLTVAGPWAAAYRIEYSPQILVPEPATWLLLPAGLAGMAVARRRQRS